MKKTKDVFVEVNEEKRTVVAYTPNCTYDAIEKIISHYPFLAMSESELKIAFMKNSYHGIARCHPEDTFDVEKGTEIAINKLIERYDKAYENAVNRFLTKVKKRLLD